MIDNVIKNKDTAVSSNGNLLRIENIFALFQSAFIQLSVPKGSFIFNKELGSKIYTVNLKDELAKEKIEQLANEALVNYKGLYATVLSVSDKIEIKLTYKNDYKIVEV